MIPLPQRGGCICGAFRFRLDEDPVTIYACHCTDCQTETGSACLLAVVVRSDAVTWEGVAPELHPASTPDGRVKDGYRCPSCRGPTGGQSRGEGLEMIEGGTFDDTSWIEPAGHIWVRSAQPWIEIPENALRFEEHPSDADWLEMTRHWKSRST